MKTKKCSKCKEVKPLSEFYTYRPAKDGLTYKCKICRNEQATQWRKDNLDRARAFGRKWNSENRDKLTASTKEWMRTHPEKASEYRTRRRARLKDAVVNDFTAGDWTEILKLYGYRCAYCGAKENLEVDHIIPLSKGGPHTKSNIAPACGHCNRVKHVKTPGEAGFSGFVNLYGEV